VPWEIVLVDAVDKWFVELAKDDPETSDLVTAAIDKLAADGPMLGRPMVDRVKGSCRHNMKELRPGSAGASELRILFIFDPQRNAVLLVAGDKAGQWETWYRENIPLPERRYERWLAEMDERR
jgi:hypothetical protein